MTYNYKKDASFYDNCDFFKSRYKTKIQRCNSQLNKYLCLKRRVSWRRTMEVGNN